MIYVIRNAFVLWASHFKAGTSHKCHIWKEQGMSISWKRMSVQLQQFVCICLVNTPIENWQYTQSWKASWVYLTTKSTSLEWYRSFCLIGTYFITWTPYVFMAGHQMSGHLDLTGYAAIYRPWHIFYISILSKAEVDQQYCINFAHIQILHLFVIMWKRQLCCFLPRFFNLAGRPVSITCSNGDSPSRRRRPSTIAFQILIGKWSGETTTWMRGSKIRFRTEAAETDLIMKWFPFFSRL